MQTRDINATELESRAHLALPDAQGPHPGVRDHPRGMWAQRPDELTARITAVRRLVDRFGRTGFAALASLIWALPMAAWAGSADLSPIDKTAYPWIALTIGLVMLVVWIVLVSRLGRIPVTPREHRFDLRQMTRAEKRWTLAAAAFFAGLVAWLNGAATVDWGPLGAAIAAGKLGPTVFAIGLAAFLVAMIAGLAFSWRRASSAFAARARPYLNVSEDQS